MSSDPLNPDYEEPRPCPLWWDYVNGAIVAIVVFAVAVMVLSWMIGVTRVVLR